MRFVINYIIFHQYVLVDGTKQNTCMHCHMSETLMPKPKRGFRAATKC